MSDTVVVTQTVQKVVVSAPGPQGASGAGGGVSDGDKGDITVSGATWTIDGGAVTYAKIQPTAAARRLIGRPDATAGTVSEISLGTGLKFDAGSLVVSTTDVVSTAVTLTAGTGLTGGGTLEANRTFAVDFATSGAATAGKAVEATDSRLSNARTPTTHKTSHATGGTDAIAPADIGAAAASHTHAAGDVTSGTFDVARIPTGTTSTTVSLGNHKHAGADITSGQVALARGGTGTDLSATGGSKQFLKQTTAGGSITVGTIAASDLPSHTHAVGDLTAGSATNGQVLTYDGINGVWAPASPSGGGITDGDKGDITVSASGATWTIDAAAVTYAKIQNVSATDKILGRSTAGAGSVEEITCTAAGRALLDDADAAAQRTTLGAAATSHTHGVGDLTAGSATSGQVLTYNGSAWAPATPSGGSGTKTYATFTPLDAQPPASNFATLDTHADIAVLEFDGGTTDESTTFVGIMPEGASLGSGLKVRIHWMADTATSGNVRWGVQFQRLTDDVDTATYDTSYSAGANEVNSAAPTGAGADGTPAVAEITMTAIDGITAGDAFRLKVYREASDTGNDTMAGDAQLFAVEVRSAA